jgi:hypothetical protein
MDGKELTGLGQRREIVGHSGDRGETLSELVPQEIRWRRDLLGSCRCLKDLKEKSKETEEAKVAGMGAAH